MSGRGEELIRKPTAIGDIFRRPASSEEVNLAITTFEETFGAPNYAQSTNCNNVIRVLINLWCSPDLKRILCSLMVDPAVWDAIGGNTAVKAIVEQFLVPDVRSIGCTDTSSSPAAGRKQQYLLHWIQNSVEGLIKVTQEILELLLSFQRFLNAPVGDSHVYRSDEMGTEQHPDGIPKAIVLSAVFIYIAIVFIRLVNFGI